MSALVNLSRRRLLIAGAALGSSLCLGLLAPPARAGKSALGDSAPVALHAWLAIDAQGVARLLVPHTETGQGIHTALALALAESLDLPLAACRCETGFGPEFVVPELGLQGTLLGSSMAQSFERVRRLAASARQMLLQAAAARWGVAPDTLRTEQGRVIGAGSGQLLDYGALAADAARLTPPDVALSPYRAPPGSDPVRLDARSKVDGSAVYGIDVKLPGLLTALLLRPPRLGAKPGKAAVAAAKSILGVRHVTEIGDCIAVVADQYWTAKQGLDALTVEWEQSAAHRHDSAKQADAHQRLLKEPGLLALARGEPAAQPPAEATLIEFEAEVAEMAHACMEPLSATAQVHADGVDIWVSTELPGHDAAVAAEVCEIPLDKVRIHPLLAGGGMGRRAHPKADFVRAAVTLSKKIQQPVKLIWRRQDEFAAGWHRPCTSVRASLALDARQRPQAAWLRIASAPVLPGTPFAARMRDGVDPTQVEGLVDWPYALPQLRVSYHPDLEAAPALWWPGGGHLHAAFVQESLIELAAERAGRDSLRYRSDLLDAAPRLQALLQRLRRHARWGRPGRGRHQGMALYQAAGGAIAAVVRVRIDAGHWRVEDIHAVIDCGQVVHREGVVAQVTSGLLLGLSAARGEAVEWVDGEVQQRDYDTYPILRLPDAPAVYVEVLDSTAPPTGIRELAVPVLAPALANALSRATGQRPQRLPIGASVG